MISAVTRDRIRRFNRITRARIALWTLLVLFVLSLFSEFIANDRPLYLRFQGKSYFPVVIFYPETEFGGKYKTMPDYHQLAKTEAFKSGGGWMVFPIVPWGPLKPDFEAGTPPSAPSGRHWLGTDASARDVFARLLYGFRISMLFALCLTGVSMMFGVIIGGVQGYVGKWVDLVGQRLIEIWSSLPFLYIVILFGSIYGRSFILLLFLFAIFSWMGISFYMRGEFLQVKNLAYVDAARAMGAGNRRILFKHILPNAVTPIITTFPFSIVGGIGGLTALDFLGLGLPPPAPSWGELMDQGIKNLQAPWISVSATLLLFITLMLATLIGEGVREAFDPKSQARLR